MVITQPFVDMPENALNHTVAPYLTILPEIRPLLPHMLVISIIG
jgi:hypothetical protein